MKQLFILMSSLLISSALWAQELSPKWAQTFGGSGNDQSTGIATDSRGGVYITGSFSSPTFTIGSTILTNQGGQDAFLARFDTSGTLSWVRHLGGPGNDTARYVTVISDGSIYLTASFSATATLGSGTLAAGRYALKLNSSGDLVLSWTGGPANASIIDRQGNFYTTSGPSYTKYGPDGTLLFSRAVTSPGSAGSSMSPLVSVDQDSYVHIMINASPNVLLTTSPATTTNYRLGYASLVRFDPSGNVVNGESLTTNPRLIYSYYKAKRGEIGAVASWYPTTGAPHAYFDWSYLVRGSIGPIGSSAFCYSIRPTNTFADFDDRGNVFFADDLPPYITECNTFDPLFAQSTTKDMFFSKSGGSSGFRGSTALNGKTDESSRGVAVDTSDNSIYYVGVWSKLADSSRFWFGASTLTNFGPTGTNDVLFLKFRRGTGVLKVDAGFDKNICLGGSAVLNADASGGAGGYTYNWTPATGLSNPSSPTPTVNPDTTTSYIVSVTDAQGNIVRDTVRVRVDRDLYKPVVRITSGTNPACEGQTVILETTGQSGSFTWSNGVTGVLVRITQTDTLTVKSVQPNGCYGISDPLIVKFNPRPAAPAVTASGPLRFCAGDSVVLTASHPDATVNFAWNPGTPAPVGRTITLKTSGTWGARVIDTLGCSSLFTNNTITADPLPPAPVLSQRDTSICEGDSILLSTPQNFSYSRVWSNGGTGFGIWVKTAGTYYAKHVNSGGCTSPQSNTVTITIKPNPVPTITGSGPLTMCAGTSLTLTANNASGASYLWSTGATTPSINVTQTANYKVTATYSNGCAATSAAAQVFVKPSPSTPIVTAGGPTTFCSGGFVTLSAQTTSINPTAITWLWSNGHPWSGVTITQSGNYTATATLEGCSVTSAPLTVTVKPRPATPTITASGPTTFCAEGSVTLTANTSTTGVSYQWSNGATTPSITVNQSGNYTVTATLDGCSSTSAATSVTVKPIPAAPSISASGSTTFCSGGSVTLTANTSTSGVAYQWSTGATTPSITVNQSGNYNVTATLDGCSSTSAATSVTVKPAPATPTITASGSTTFCAGGSVTLTANTSTTGVTYQWSNGATTPSITVNQSGNYTVTATLDGCSSTSAATAVTVKPIPAAPSVTASGPTTFCAGSSVNLTASSTSGATYQWSTGATSANISVNQSGTYTVTATLNGCTSPSASTTVTVNAIPATPSITASGATTFCAGGNVTLTASSSTSGATYAWSNGASTSSITVSQSGNYSVTATANGCTSPSASASVTVNPAPVGTITASGSTNICTGDSVQLSISTASGNTWQWSTGSTAQSIWVKTGGSYSAQLTSAQGCTASSNSITVNALQRPSPVISQSGNQLTVTPAASAYQWYLDGSAISGATSQTLTITEGGDYSVLVTGSNGCTQMAYHNAVFRIVTGAIAYQAWPNPVTAGLHMAYTLNEPAAVTLTIVNDQGQQKVFVQLGQQPAGDHSYDLPNAALRLGTGIYLLKIQAGSKQVVHRFVVL
jgi:hypothetical protein